MNGGGILSIPGGPLLAVRQNLPLDLLPTPGTKRAKLWELNPSIHCSIIGTCLTTRELRRVMSKIADSDVAHLSDHDLHGEAVGLCGRFGPAAKLLHKTLDDRHESVIKRFARLRGGKAVLEAWAEARRAGDIPGAYWAVLTHPDTGHGGIKRVFGDVHMLSHLVGAANRADIRRLASLEAENALLEGKIERQQARLQTAFAERDAVLRSLGALAADAASMAAKEDVPEQRDDAALRRLVAELQSRLSSEATRRERLEQRVRDGAVALAACQQRAEQAERRAESLERELQVLAQLSKTRATTILPAERILYVGGFPAVVAQLRSLIEAAGGALLVHDGGRHDHPSLLPGLIGQAVRVLFPLDCVSHEAALAIKRFCRPLGIPFHPLRSSGLSSAVAALMELQAEAATRT